MKSKLVLVALLTILFAGCSYPPTGPAFHTGDVVIIKEQADTPTPADGPLGIVLFNWAATRPKVGVWVYEVAFQGCTVTAEQKDLTKVGHFDWNKLPEVCEDWTLPIKPKVKLPVIPPPKST